METKVEGVKQTEKVEIEKVVVNPGWRPLVLPNYNNTIAAKLRKCCKITSLILALVSPILLSGAPAFAQADNATNQKRHTEYRYKRPSIDDRVKVLAKNLDLNEAQQSAVKKILEQRQQETLRLRLDSSLTGSDRIDRFRALQAGTVQRIRAVLNDEQRKKYDPLAVQRIPSDPNQRSVEDWLKATTPR